MKIKTYTFQYVSLTKLTNEELKKVENIFGNIVSNVKDLYISRDKKNNNLYYAIEKLTTDSKKLYQVNVFRFTIIDSKVEFIGNIFSSEDFDLERVSGKENCTLEDLNDIQLSEIAVGTILDNIEILNGDSNLEKYYSWV